MPLAPSASPTAQDRPLEGGGAGARQDAPDTHTPPKAVQEAAQRAQRWVAEGYAGDGFTDVGRARMAQLAAGEGVSDNTVLKMADYFSRHAKDKQAPDFDNTTEPSAGRVAWDAWGGDAGERWASALAEKLRAEGVKREDALRFDDVPPALRAKLAPPSQTPQGTWRVEGVVAVEGVRAYPWGGELVRADALKDPEFLASLAGLILTDEHPEELVSGGTARRVDTGERVLSARWDDGAKAVIAVFEVKDKGGAAGLSIGLHPVEVKAGEGTHDGARYVAEQVRLRANHVARTPRPRVTNAGLRLDAAPAQAGERAMEGEMIEVEIGGVKYKLPKDAAEALLKERADMADKMKQEGAKMDSLKGENAGLEARLDGLKASLDALTKEAGERRLDALKADLADKSPAQADAVRAAQTDAEAYRAALPAPVVARLDADGVGSSPESLKAAFGALLAHSASAAANADAQTAAPEGAKRQDAAAPKPIKWGQPIGLDQTRKHFDATRAAK
ncbi:MAG: DUF2213 domain-containing protein [Desulfurellales bacterium]|nr:MAG: DUF2213 domain-containing protein [Desulfurellales bacterium]